MNNNLYRFITLFEYVNGYKDSDLDLNHVFDGYIVRCVKTLLILVMFAAIPKYLWLYIFINIEMKANPFYHGIKECYLLLEFRGFFKIEYGFIGWPFYWDATSLISEFIIILNVYRYTK